jgi:hypothetical protein
LLVATESDLFDPATIVLTDVMTLLRLFTKKLHEWDADSSTSDRVRAGLRAEAPQQAETMAQLARKAFQKKTTHGLPWRASLSVNNSNIAEALSDLHLPAVVVCEDVVTDAAFVRALANIFSRGEIADALFAHRIAFANGGGARLPWAARSEMEKFQIKPRVFVLFDSDSLTPGEQTKSHAAAEALRDDGASVHVLRRREAENYIPPRAIHHGGVRIGKFNRQRDLSRALTALKNLSTEQYSHYDFKKGFKAKSFAPVKPMPEQVALFSNLNSRTLRTLGQGFGDKILACVVEHQDILTIDDFDRLGPDVTTELEAILDQIGYLL